MKQVYIATFCMYCGILLRDAAILHRSKKNWSFTARIIDWTKVEAMTEGKDLANPASDASARNFGEPLPQVVTQSLSPPSRNLNLPQLVVAGLGFVPLFGLPFAISAIAWGLAIRQRLGITLVILGAAGPILSFALIVIFVSLIGPMLFSGPSAKERSNKFIATWLMRAGQEIEAFKKGSGRYPERLNEMAESTRSLLFDDPSQPAQIIGGSSKQRTFYYQRFLNPPGYFLFSVGADGKPFTSDDVLPTKSKALPGLRLPSQ